MSTLRECARDTETWWNNTATEAQRRTALNQASVIRVCPRVSYTELASWTWSELPEAARYVLVATRYVGLPDSLQQGGE